MKIVYFGTDVFLPCFRYLADREEVLALYSYHNDEDYFTEHEIVREARSRGIPVTLGRIDEERVRSFFEKEGCELFFVAEYNYVIPIPADLVRFRGLNVHSSLLPEGRGCYPIECAMARGLRETGVTMHKIVPQVDTGDVLFQSRIGISPEMDCVDVYLESSRRALELTKRLFADFENAWAAACPQGRIGDFWAKPSRDLMTIDHGMTVAQAMAVYRSYDKMTLVRIGGRLYHVVAAERGRATLICPEIEVSDGHFLYEMADGHLRLAVLKKGAGE